ncbi:MAG TPA: response regulator transcription factor [Pyrinomonadaceae bacterium]|jgi:DNA-binding NarL/FixJ family response regulator|nr:response regulator transcription factor [Pyrinomonadaceae bacterium]
MTDPNKAPLRVLIVDDHDIVCAGLRMLIQNAGIEVVGTASNAAAALELASRLSPDVILLDLDLAGEDGLALLPELREAAKQTRVLILTGVRDVEAHRSAIRMGAMGVVLKSQAAEILIKAIEKVFAGEIWVDRATMGDVLSEMTRRQSNAPDPDEQKIKTLTEREHQVIALIAEGLKNKQIAKRLFISETTVTHHLSSIFSKLEVTDRLELVIYAFGHSLARIPK